MKLFTISRSETRSFQLGNFAIGLPSLCRRNEQWRSFSDSEGVFGWIGSVFHRLFYYGHPGGVRNDRGAPASKWKVDYDRPCGSRRSLRRNWRRTAIGCFAAQRDGRLISRFASRRTREFPIGIVDSFAIECPRVIRTQLSAPSICFAQSSLTLSPRYVRTYTYAS